MEDRKFKLANPNLTPVHTGMVMGGRTSTPEFAGLVTLADGTFVKGGKRYKKVEPEDTVEIKGGEQFVVTDKMGNIVSKIRAEASFNDDIRAMNDEVSRWMDLNADGFKLQSNECSRMHLLAECVDRTAEKLDMGDFGAWSVIEPFVVRHDWAAAFGESLGDVLPNELKLPFPMTAFEFKISGRYVTVIASELDEGALDFKTFVLAGSGSWAVFGAKHHPVDEKLKSYLTRQIGAICVMLDSEIADSTTIRQPDKLNQKRQKAGKAPLRDYHVVDLSIRHRAPRNQLHEPSGTRVRCHFRRGHWVHAESRPKADEFRHATAQRWTPHNGRWRTWVKWVLVGDPDLGFVNHEYKL